MDSITEKYCRKCKTTKPVGDFRPTKHTKDGLYTSCRVCENKRRAIYRKKHEKEIREYDKEYRSSHTRPYHKSGIKYKYGITKEDYDKKLEQQKGVCAVCGEPPKNRRLSIDHNHTTGRVRDLLCQSCNLALGFARDSIIILGSLKDYLAKHQE